MLSIGYGFEVIIIINCIIITTTSTFITMCTICIICSIIDSIDTMLSSGYGCEACCGLAALKDIYPWRTSSLVPIMLGFSKTCAPGGLKDMCPLKLGTH